MKRSATLALIRLAKARADISIIFEKTSRHQHVFSDEWSQCIKMKPLYQVVFSLQTKFGLKVVAAKVPEFLIKTVDKHSIEVEIIKIIESQHGELENKESISVKACGFKATVAKSEGEMVMSFFGVNTKDCISLKINSGENVPSSKTVSLSSIIDKGKTVMSLFNRSKRDIPALELPSAKKGLKFFNRSKRDIPALELPSPEKGLKLFNESNPNALELPKRASARIKISSNRPVYVEDCDGDDEPDPYACDSDNDPVYDVAGDHNWEDTASDESSEETMVLIFSFFMNLLNTNV